LQFLFLKKKVKSNQLKKCVLQKKKLKTNFSNFTFPKTRLDYFLRVTLGEGAGQISDRVISHLKKPFTANGIMNSILCCKKKCVVAAVLSKFIIQTNFFSFPNSRHEK
jgi:hypothetical protein